MKFGYVRHEHKRNSKWPLRLVMQRVPSTFWDRLLMRRVEQPIEYWSKGLGYDWFYVERTTRRSLKINVADLDINHQFTMVFLDRERERVDAHNEALR